MDRGQRPRPDHGPVWRPSDCPSAAAVPGRAGRAAGVVPGGGGGCGATPERQPPGAGPLRGGRPPLAVVEPRIRDGEPCRRSQPAASVRRAVHQSAAPGPWPRLQPGLHGLLAGGPARWLRRLAVSRPQLRAGRRRCRRLRAALQPCAQGVAVDPRRARASESVLRGRGLPGGPQRRAGLADAVRDADGHVERRHRVAQRQLPHVGRPSEPPARTGAARRRGGRRGGRRRPRGPRRVGRHVSGGAEQRHAVALRVPAALAGPGPRLLPALPTLSGLRPPHLHGVRLRVPAALLLRQGAAAARGRVRARRRSPAGGVHRRPAQRPARPLGLGAPRRQLLLCVQRAHVTLGQGRSAWCARLVSCSPTHLVSLSPLS